MNKKYREIVIRNSMRNFPSNLIRTSKSLISMMKSADKAALPYKIQIEPSAYCNLKCKMCPYPSLKRHKGFLTFENFKKIYDQIRPPYITITGIGEALLNPDIFKILRYAKKSGSFVKMDTNGMLLTKEKIEKLLDCKPDIISNSIDGMDKKTYESIRVGADFDKVIKNLKELVKTRNEKKSKTEIHIFLVLQKSNFKQFPDFVRFGDSIGVNSISGTFVTDVMSREDKKNYSISHIKSSELDKLIEDIRKVKKEIKANLEEEDIIRYIKTWRDKKKKNWSKVPCFKPWYSPFINWDGDVGICCYCVDKEIIIGNTLEEPFEKIWNNKKMQAIRKMVRTKRVGLCAECEADETSIKEKFEKLPFYNKVTKRK